MSGNDETGLPLGGDSDTDATDARAGKTRSLFGKVRVGAVILLAVVIIVVVARNWEPITVDVMGRKIDVPLSVLVILTFLFGALVGFLLAFFRPWRKS